jgi:hypothetical protein
MSISSCTCRNSTAVGPADRLGLRGNRLGHCEASPPRSQSPFSAVTEGHNRQLRARQNRTVDISALCWSRRPTRNPLRESMLLGMWWDSSLRRSSGVGSMVDWHRPAQPLECPTRIADDLTLPVKFDSALPGGWFAESRRNRTCPWWRGSMPDISALAVAGVSSNRLTNLFCARSENET